MGAIWQWFGTVCLILVVSASSVVSSEELDHVRETRTMVDVGTKPWPNGVVYYKFSSDFGGGRASSKSKVLQAMSEWSRQTCIRFIETTSSSKGIVTIRNGPGGCNANQGHPGNGRTFYINLEYPACINYRVALHEIGHILGLAHEHQNPLRTNLKVFWDKIEADRVRWFYAKHPDAVENFGIGYDPLSVMHYNKEGFAKITGDRTMQYTASSTIDSQMGKLNQLSTKSDVAIIKKFYNCDGKGVDLTKVLNSNACFDNFVQCPQWQQRGDCTSNRSFMRSSCRKSCSICRAPVTSTSTSTNTNTNTNTNSGCVDLNKYCSSWSKTSQCTLNSPYMSKNCPKSCGLCEKSVCEDKHPSCYDWYKRGECSNNPNYMLLYCKASCNVCSTTCVDSSAYCLSWARLGHCSSSTYRPYMQSNCKKACSLC